MALPKRRWSKTRTRKGRTHKKLGEPLLSVCPKCKKPKLPHHLCPVCGYYKGRTVIEIEDKKKDKKPKK
ncbi:MAG TPA: 50S ribosomal protein L32 [Candidatus Omnitrophica bacterium]|nr:50S ribosomal protein L32 [Candidatus Omnitrophota bacterium]